MPCPHGVDRYDYDCEKCAVDETMHKVTKWLKREADEIDSDDDIEGFKSALLDLADRCRDREWD